MKYILTFILVSSIGLGVEIPAKYKNLNEQIICKSEITQVEGSNVPIFRIENKSSQLVIFPISILEEANSFMRLSKNGKIMPNFSSFPPTAAELLDFTVSLPPGKSISITGTIPVPNGLEDGEYTLSHDILKSLSLRVFIKGGKLVGGSKK